MHASNTMQLGLEGHDETTKKSDGKTGKPTKAKEWHCSSTDVAGYSCPCFGYCNCGTWGEIP